MALFAAERQYDGIIESVAQVYAVPPNVVRAVVARESRFNPRALRGEPQINDASRGLMQILYRTARAVGFSGQPDDLFSPEVNLTFGTRYLAEQYRRAGSWPAAISAYNGGYRPAEGFGAPATRALRVCLARNQRTGECENWHQVKVGEYANQAHVDSVLRYYTYFETGKYPMTVADAVIPAMLAGLLILGGT